MLDEAMTPANAPLRPRRFGRPLWLNSDWPLPVVSLEPSPDQGQEAELEWIVWVLVGPQHLSIRVRQEQISGLLSDWRDGPEEALVKWWGCKAPTRSKQGARAEALATNATLEELGL